MEGGREGRRNREARKMCEYREEGGGRDRERGDK